MSGDLDTDPFESFAAAMDENDQDFDDDDDRAPNDGDDNMNMTSLNLDDCDVIGDLARRSGHTRLPSSSLHSLSSRPPPPPPPPPVSSFLFPPNDDDDGTLSPPPPSSFSIPIKIEDASSTTNPQHSARQNDREYVDGSGERQQLSATASSSPCDFDGVSGTMMMPLSMDLDAGLTTTSLNLDQGGEGSDHDRDHDRDYEDIAGIKQPSSSSPPPPPPPLNVSGFASPPAPPPVAPPTTSTSYRKKSSSRARWLVLAMTCAVMTGSYYAYDVPSALHQQLKDRMPPAPDYETRFNLLYTVYSVPNVVLPLLGGNVVDRHGAPQCLTAFASLVFLGAAILSAGVNRGSWGVMYLGRFVFGLGAESLCVAQSTIVSEWFQGREVAFAMGIGLAVSRLGSIWNNIVSPKVANASGGGVTTAFWIGAGLSLCSVVTAGFIGIVDRRVTRKLERRAGAGEALQSLTEALLENEEGGQSRDDGDRLLVRAGSSGGDNPHPAGEDYAVVDRDETSPTCAAPVESGVHITDIRTFTPLFWLLTLSCFVVYGCVLPFNNVASGILLERNFFASPPEDCALEYPDQCSVGYLQPGTNPSLDANDDVCSIAPSQAPVLPSSVNYTGADSERSGEWEETEYAYPSLTSDQVDCGDPFWSDACTSEYCGKQHAATERAGKVMSIPYLISAASSPPLGHLVDRIGRRAQIAVFSSSLLFAVHLTLAAAASSPVGPMVGQGIAYSLYAAVLWPSVPLAVPRQYTGTAFGVITSIQNIGLALFPLMIAAIYNASGGRYIPNVEFFFMACAAAGVVVAIFMNRLDRRYGNKLNGVCTEEKDGVIGTNGPREEGAEDFSTVEGEDKYFSPLLQSEQGII